MHNENKERGKQGDKTGKGGSKMTAKTLPKVVPRATAVYVRQQKKGKHAIPSQNIALFLSLHFRKKS